MLKINLNNPINSFISEKRLIFFAQQKPLGSDSAEQQGSDFYLKQLQEFAEAQPKKYDERGKAIKNPIQEVLDLQSNPAIDPGKKMEPEGCKEILDVVKDPNLMVKDEYKDFIKALAKGKLSGKTTTLRLFLKSLRAPKGSELNKYAKRLFRSLSSASRGEITKDELKKLNRLNKQQEAEEGVSEEERFIQEIFQATPANAGIITASADIHHSIREQLPTPEAERESVWKMGELPDEDGVEIRRLSGERKSMVDSVHGLFDDIERKEGELALEEKEKKPDSEKVTALKIEIEKIREKIVDHHKKIDQLSEIIDKKELEFLTRARGQFRAMQKFARESGLEADLPRIKIWALDLAKGDGDSLNIKGYVGEIKITKITFEPVEEFHGNLESEQDRALNKLQNEASRLAPGRMLIHYLDENGKEVMDDLREFMNFLNAFEGVNEIESFEELNERLANETGGHRKIVAGDKFTATVLTDLDTHETTEIEVLEVDEKKGTITLKDPVKTGRREKMGLSLDNRLYFDRYQQNFTYGQFAKFIKQNGYARNIEVEEIPAACEADQRRVNDQCQEAAKFTPPTEANLPKEILILLNGQLRKFNIFLDPSNKKKPYVLEEVRMRFSENEDYLTTLLNAGIPMYMASSNYAKALLFPPIERLSERELLDMNNKGLIADSPPTHSNEPKSPADLVPPGEKFGIRKKRLGDSSALDLRNQRTARAPQGDPDEPVPDVPIFSQEPVAQDEDKAKPQAKPKFYAEALAYEQVHKVGGMEPFEASYLKSVWTKTRFLSISDMWEMGKAMWEYYDRRFQRRQKDRYSSIGTELPFFAPEMRRINQATETEAMNQFKESFDQKGVFEIWDRLTQTKNRDEMKACFITLASKGQIRWDDLNVWRKLNYFTADDKQIPIPTNGDPNTIVKDPGPGMAAVTGFDYLKPAIDSLFGEGQFNDWYSQNKSTFQGNARKFYEEGKEIEGLEGGHERRLATLLKQHMDGIFVDPQEYEGLILHSIEFGKASMQTKLYYMVQGVTKQNSSGRTIMPFDRIAHINSEMLLRFPILQYMTDPVPRPPDGKKSHRWTLDDYKEWAKLFDGGNRDNCVPNSNVDKFLWTYVLPSNNTQERINKALRHGENIDHDDMYAYIPPATEEVITDVCKATVGTKKFLTIEGYCNAFPGFSQYIRSCAETDKRTKLREAVKSFVRFESIMTDRFEKDKEYQRIKTNMLNTPTVVSTDPPKAFIDQLNGNIKQIIEAYIASTDDAELKEVYKWMYLETPNLKISKTERETQKKVDWALDRFGTVFDRVVKSDNGEKMVSITAAANLTGMPYRISDTERAQRKAQFADATALEG